jgi:hypothetical protein
VRLADTLHREWSKIAEPALLLPVVAVALLTLVWTATIKLIRLRHADTEHVARRLARLKDRGLLPPDLLFVVSTADRRGAVVDSTRAPQELNAARQDYFRAQLERDAFFIGQPPRGSTDHSTLAAGSA